MKCKRCNCTNIKSVDDYMYEDGETDVVEPINAKICHDCGCIHWEDDENVMWEYYVTDKSITDEAVEGWTTDQQVNKLNLN